MYVYFYHHEIMNLYLYFNLISTLQSSSIDFLASQGFDFNKVFKEGSLNTFAFNTIKKKE